MTSVNDNEPKFEPVSTQLERDGETYPVIVEASVIHALWALAPGRSPERERQQDGESRR